MSDKVINVSRIKEDEIGSDVSEYVLEGTTDDFNLPIYMQSGNSAKSRLIFLARAGYHYLKEEHPVDKKEAENGQAVDNRSDEDREIADSF